MQPLKNAKTVQQVPCYFLFHICYYMNFKKLLILIVILSFGCDSDSEISYQDPDLIFVANEGNLEQVNYCNEYGKTVSELGDVVQ